MNPDIEQERQSSHINPGELYNFLHGGPIAGKRLQELANLVANDPVLQEGKYRRYNLDQRGLYDWAMQKGVRFLQVIKEHNLSEEDTTALAQHISYDIGFGVHLIMFLPALEKLASEEQKAKWMPLAKSFRILGTYGQTELGHGTDLRHLQTVADYDAKSEQFVLNTAIPSGMKWWPGGLGKTVNHVLLLAQLRINGQNMGMQPFLVQIRRLDNHMPLPGVEVGDIGPTVTAVVSDNGYLALTNVRIPRENMLMRNNEVTADGRFIKRGSDKSTYGTMILIRANICGIAFHLTSRAVTIATRYSAVRRQSEMKPGAPEPQVLSYQTQQMKLLPNIALAYALHFTWKYITNTYNAINSEMNEGNYERLPELHAQAAGFKALCTDLAAEAVEVCRRSCGGHGYLYSSGICTLLHSAMGSVTYEGENTVLYMQTARYLLKKLAAAKSGASLTGSLSFLTDAACRGPVTFSSSNKELDRAAATKVFQIRCKYLLEAAGGQMEADMAAGLEMYEAWDKNSYNLVRAAKAYVELMMVTIFLTESKRMRIRPTTSRVVGLLSQLHALHRLTAAAGELLESGAMMPAQMTSLRDQELSLLPIIRPHAVKLVDAFGHTDDSLTSALGRYDGNVYDALVEAAKESPMNREQVNPSFLKHLKPYLEKQAKL